MEPQPDVAAFLDLSDDERKMMARAFDEFAGIRQRLSFPKDWGADDIEELETEFRLALFRSDSLYPSPPPAAFPEFLRVVDSEMAPQESQYWCSPETAAGLTSKLEGAESGVRIVIVSGSLRYALFNRSEIVSSLQDALSRGVRVRLIVGPQVECGPDRNNDTLRLLGRPGFEFLLSSYRWETHGQFLEGSQSYFEIPHFEVEDLRRPLELAKGDAAIEFLDRERIRHAQGIRQIHSLDDLPRGTLVTAHEMWEQAAKKYGAQEHPLSSVRGIIINGLHLRALAKTSEVARVS